VCDLYPIQATHTHTHTQNPVSPTFFLPLSSMKVCCFILIIASSQLGYAQLPCSWGQINPLDPQTEAFDIPRCVWVRTNFQPPLTSQQPVLHTTKSFEDQFEAWIPRKSRWCWAYPLNHNSSLSGTKTVFCQEEDPGLDLTGTTAGCDRGPCLPSAVDIAQYSHSILKCPALFAWDLFLRAGLQPDPLNNDRLILDTTANAPLFRPCAARDPRPGFESDNFVCDPIGINPSGQGLVVCTESYEYTVRNVELPLQFSTDVQVDVTGELTFVCNVTRDAPTMWTAPDANQTELINGIDANFEVHETFCLTRNLDLKIEAECAAYRVLNKDTYGQLAIPGIPTTLQSNYKCDFWCQFPFETYPKSGSSLCSNEDIHQDCHPIVLTEQCKGNMLTEPAAFCPDGGTVLRVQGSIPSAKNQTFLQLMELLGENETLQDTNSWFDPRLVSVACTVGDFDCANDYKCVCQGSPSNPCTKHPLCSYDGTLWQSLDPKTSSTCQCDKNIGPTCSILAPENNRCDETSQEAAVDLRSFL